VTSFERALSPCLETGEPCATGSKCLPSSSTSTLPGLWGWGGLRCEPSILRGLEQKTPHMHQKHDMC